MAVRIRSLSTIVLFEITNSNGYGGQLPHPRNPISLPRLSFTKPSWVVRTELKHILFQDLIVERTIVGDLGVPWKSTKSGSVALCTSDSPNKLLFSLPQRVFGCVALIIGGDECLDRSDGIMPLSISQMIQLRGSMSNVRKEEKMIPDPPCAVCMGSGRTDCHQCCGRGRTNYVHLEMLPKGKWPKWCRTCGGSGLDYCPRCLGTGEYRYIMGFQFMKMDANNNQDHKNDIQRNQKCCSVADFYEE